jgi:hypothetical protein
MHTALPQVQNNQLRGSLPAEWAGSRAIVLVLDGNHLTGPAFPPAWLDASMPALAFLSLSNATELTGTLPPNLPFRWPHLVDL